jgi:hypothetical protein
MSDTTEADWQAHVEYIAATLGTAISADTILISYDCTAEEEQLLLALSHQWPVSREDWDRAMLVLERHITAVYRPEKATP